MDRIKNVLFLQPTGGVENYSPPLGLGYVATYLKNKLPEIKVKITDLSIEKIEPKQLIDSFKPDIIAVTGVTPIAKEIRLLLEAIRAHNSKIPIVIGGPHVSVFKSEIFYLPVDFAVIGEGEEVFFELIKAINDCRDLSGVAGLIYRASDGKIRENRPCDLIADIDTIPRVDRSLFKMEKYALKGTLISTRGCPYDCIFCSQSFGRSWRAHSPEYIFDVIKELVDQHGAQTIRFMDDNPLIRKDRFQKICDLILSSGYQNKVKFELNHGTRMDIADKDTFLLLKKIGVKKIWFGLESANQQVLEGMRKQLSLESIGKAIEIAHSLGFMVNAFITIGMPGDNYQRSMQTMDYVRKNKIDLVSPTVATPFPGTDLYDWVDKKGRWINKDFETWASTQSILFDTKDFPAQERARTLQCWLRFCAWQRIKLAMQDPFSSIKFAVKNPGLVRVSLSNLFGKARNKRKDFTPAA